MTRHSLRVDTVSRSYEIVIGRGVLGDDSAYPQAGNASTAIVVSNDTVAKLFGARVRQELGRSGRRVEFVILPEGEEHKVWGSVQQILDAMFAAHCDRDTVVYALGGGVVGDITGFAASCYMRGVAFVQLPTTLLAQVDSSVGGKTGINHPAGKNLIGAFYQPKRVLVDVDTLDTLPQRELIAGLAEVIKYGVACDVDFLGWIEANIELLVSRDKDALAEAIRRSCEIKARIVAVDERESGVRAILNFGHTFGHAIEVGAGYGTWLHGEAVGCGMVLATDLSRRLGLIDDALVHRIGSLIRKAGLPVTPPDLGEQRFLELMQLDKKAQGGKLRFVLLEGAGRSAVRSVPPEVVAATVASLAHPDSTIGA